MDYLTLDVLAIAGDSVAKRRAEEIRNQSLIMNLIKRFWEVEALPNDQVPKMTVDELYALDILKSTARLMEDGRYEVGCLWKQGEPNLQNNYCYAIKRLDNLPRSKKYDWSQVYQWMDEIFLSWEAEGKIFQVPTDNPRTDKAFYWPVFPVLKGGTDSRMSQCRPVMDGAAAGGPNKTSINAALHKGPNFANSMISVMLRFRRFPIAWVSDASEMFTNCRLNKEDGKYHRFLWRRGDKIIVYQSIGHVFGNKGSPAVAMYVVQTEAERLRDLYPEAAETIRESTVIDDNMDSYEDIETAVKARDDTIKIYNGVGMKIKKMASNDARLLENIPEENILKDFRGPMSQIAYPPVDEVYIPDEDGEDFHLVPVYRESCAGKEEPGDDQAVRLNPKDPGAQVSMKALGVKWDATEDCFVFDVAKLDFSTVKVTKRMALSYAHSIFDPLGFVAACVVEPRRIIQSSWSDKLNWDEELKPAEAERWKEWCSELHYLSQVKVPRALIPSKRSDLTRMELHTFSDASEKAYGAVTYCLTERLVNGLSKVTIRYVMARVKIAPLQTKTIKKLSIPRLELMGALLGKEIYETVNATLSIPETNCYFWSDSACVLCWLKFKAENLEIFVSNRTVQIKEATRPENWFHVPGIVNPADIISRGANAKEMVQSQLLWEGPPYLKEGYAKWPKQPPSTIPTLAKKELKVDFLTAMEKKNPEAIVETMREVAERDGPIVACVATILGHDVFTPRAAAVSAVETLEDQSQGSVIHVAGGGDAGREADPAVVASLSLPRAVEAKSKPLFPARRDPAKDALKDPAKDATADPAKDAGEEAADAVPVVEDALDDGGAESVPGLDDQEYQEVIAAYSKTAQGNNDDFRRLVRTAQEHCFPEDLKQLRRHGLVARRSKIVCLGPKLDPEGIIRLPGRLKGAHHLRWEVQNPILLHADCTLAQCLMRHFHENVLGHVGGKNHLLAELNKSFWIVRGRPSCRKYLKRCIRCQRAHAAQKTVQVEAPLPEDRIPGERRIRPFTSVLYDAAGPFYTRQPNRRAHQKRWFVIFRCAMYGACHIEMLYDMSAEKFIEAFERFASIRGWPERCHSDRGTNFVRGAKTITEFLAETDQSEVLEGLRLKKPSCQFTFATPRSPWKVGGAEAFVKLAKQALARVLYDGQFTDDQLHTALAKITGMLNSRPIAYQNAPEHDDFIPVTPNTFLLGDWWDEIGDISETEARSYASRWKVFSQMKDAFWNTFVGLVRSGKRRYTKWPTERKDLQIGNLVLMFEKRAFGLWPLARVIDVKIHPEDQRVRSAVVKLQDGRVFERPINRLHVIRDEKEEIEISPEEREAIAAELEEENEDSA